MNLTGKRALITGGTKGIGAAIAIDLARQGCDVAINGRIDDESAAAVRHAIASASRKCVTIIGDVCAAGRKRANCPGNRGRPGRVGHFDPLGRRAVVGHHRRLPTRAVEGDVRRACARGIFPVPRALPLMRKAGEGAVILVSSVAGVRGCPNAIAYGTAKAAILHFTRMLARDEADNNIRVNCIAPGIIRTRFHDTMTPEAKAHNLAVRIPLHREGTSEQVAEAVRVLITNDFITGELLVVDGGCSMQVCR